MSNAFTEARKIEMESRKIIEPLLEKHTDGRFVYTDKGRLSKEFQLKYGDALINENKSGGFLSIEMKAERRATGNLFLETWSNGSVYRLGWMFHSDSDVLFYHFLNSDELYILKMQALKRWFWFGIGPKRRDGTIRIHIPGYIRFKQVKQREREQMNDTWGCLTPVKDLAQEVGLRKVNPLGLFGMSAAA